jgi:LL-diaminopimelate aminotransferase
LTELVEWCIKNGSILVFDAAYAPFIQNKDVPKSIFEIPRAKECSIEVNSFSKYAGFTGVRLGWTIVPKDLKFEDGSPVRDDFNRVMSTSFNGASNIVQSGGLAILDKEGMKEIETLIEYYLGNSKILCERLSKMGFDVHGGTDAPYVFIGLNGTSSWDMF